MKLNVSVALLALAMAQGVSAQLSQPDPGAPAAAAPAPVDPAAANAAAAESSATTTGATAGTTGAIATTGAAASTGATAAASEAALSAAREGNIKLLAARDGDPEAGAAKAAPCAACHGSDGNSVDPANPKLAGQGEWFVARQLMLFKTDVRQNAIMKAFADALSPQDMRDLGAYFQSQSVRSGTADEGLVTAAGPHLGKKLYVVGEQLYRGGDMARGIPACLACHGPSGAGNPGSAFARLTGQHAGYTQARLERYRAGEQHGSARDNPNAPIMAEIAAKLTDLEIGALSTYIEGLHVFDPKASVAALTPSAAASKEPDSAGPATTAPGAATIDSAAAPGPAGPTAPNPATQAPAATDGGDGAN